MTLLLFSNLLRFGVGVVKEIFRNDNAENTANEPAAPAPALVPKTPEPKPPVNHPDLAPSAVRAIQLGGFIFLIAVGLTFLYMLIDSGGNAFGI